MGALKFGDPELIRAIRQEEIRRKGWEALGETPKYKCTVRYEVQYTSTEFVTVEAAVELDNPQDNSDVKEAVWAAGGDAALKDSVGGEFDDYELIHEKIMSIEMLPPPTVRCTKTIEMFPTTVAAGDANGKRPN